MQKHYGHDCELSTFTPLEAFIRSTTTGPIELLSLDIDAAVSLDISFDLVDVRYLSYLGDARERVLHHLATNRFEFVGQGVDHNGYDYLYVKRGI